LAIANASLVVQAVAAKGSAQKTQRTNENWNMAHGILAFLRADAANGCLFNVAEKPFASVSDTLRISTCAGNCTKTIASIPTT
jgi:hypothetical protein